MTAQELEIAGRKLVIHESSDTNDPTTGRALTGSWLWDSALHLADWLATQPVAGRDVLELGAGTGLPGLFAAVSGANRIVLTDMSPLLPGLRRNAEANGLDRVEVRELDWARPELGGGELFDVVLMADVLYDPEEMEGLGRVLERVCGNGSTVWAATEVRPSSGECLAALGRMGFEVVEMEVRTRNLLRSPEETAAFAVYQITPPAKEDEGNGGN